MTPLTDVLLVIGLLGASGLLALINSGRLGLWLVSLSAFVACAFGAAAALAALLDGAPPLDLHGPALPLGSMHVGLDPLSALFLVCVFVVGGLGALYGAGYLEAGPERRLTSALVFYPWLIGAMAAVVISRDAILFLFAWEVMSISSFFLVTFENERPEVQRAGYIYLVASHAGVVLLFIAFGLLARGAGSFDFDAFTAAGAAGAPAAASLVFFLGLAGFGVKAGVWPLHVWLPEAHPAAPSHVSAVMSGVMIKMGIYGVVRLLGFLGPPHGGWGVMLLALGAASAIMGVVLALAQHDIKRFLAYSSVENIGIITLGLGVGIIGRAQGNELVSLLGFGGALLHVLNHGLMKGLLFQSAGSVLHATGTRNIDALGGLARKAPLTAGAFLVGALAISGLPPFNGFVGEWLVFSSALRGGTGLHLPWGVAAVLVVPVLALTGGLAVAAFVRAYGLTFLGEPRSEATAHAHESPWPMRGGMILGGALCLAAGLQPSFLLSLVERPAAFLAGANVATARLDHSAALAITNGALAFLLVLGVLAAMRALLLRRRDVRRAPTWGCGYEEPTARMQYTSASFAEPLLSLFSPVLPCARAQAGPAGYFPAGASYTEAHVDAADERFFSPLFSRAVGLLTRLRIIQQGRTQLYLAYVLVTLIVLLVWQLGFGGR